MAHQRFQPLLTWQRVVATFRKRKCCGNVVSDRLRSEIGRLDVKDIVTDSRGRLTLEVRDALNSGSAGQKMKFSPAADNTIAEAAERVTAETKGKVPVINPNESGGAGY